MDRETDIEIPRPHGTDDIDQIVVLRNVPWSQYQALVRARGKSRHPRMAYLDGVLEIMTTSTRHEIAKKLMARLLEAFAEERYVSLNGAGQATFRKKAKAAGLEPDECYFIGKVVKAPSLAIEIVHKSGGVKKLEIYRRLGVVEVWFFVDGRIWIYRLVGSRHQLQETSTALRGIDLRQLEQYLGHGRSGLSDRNGSRVSPDAHAAPSLITSRAGGVRSATAVRAPSWWHSRVASAR